MITICDILKFDEQQTIVSSFMIWQKTLQSINSGNKAAISEIDFKDSIVPSSFSHHSSLGEPVPLGLS